LNLSNQLHLHSRLKRRIVVDCTIETHEPLHLGTGKETLSVSEVDMPTMVDVNDNPVIPGSSIKGTLRAHITRLLLSLDSSTCKKIFNVGKVKASEDELRDFQTANMDEKSRKFENLGVVDKLFGASGYASPLRITDATLASEAETIERTHVRIDVETDRAKEGGLFSVEAVPENQRFSFKLVFDEPNDGATADMTSVFYKLLLQQLDKGLELFLGGMKSRGYGFCTIKAKQIQSYTPEDLALGKTPEPIKDVNQFVENVLKDVS